jgi:hypothetical protein
VVVLVIRIRNLSDLAFVLINGMLIIIGEQGKSLVKRENWTTFMGDYVSVTLFFCLKNLYSLMMLGKQVVVC